MRYEITAAILEIYNETVVDLLAPGGKAELELARSASGFDVPDVTRVGEPKQDPALSHDAELS